MYAYGANNPVRYIDPTGQFIKEVKHLWTGIKQFFDFSKKGFSRWAGAVMNPENINSLNAVTNFMNESPQFWGVLGATGLLVAGGYKLYSTSPKIKMFVDGWCDYAVELNEAWLNKGGDILNTSYKYIINDETRFTIKIQDLSNLKTDILLEKVLYRINDEKGNILRLNMNFKAREIKDTANMIFTISFSFNARFKEQTYEEFLLDSTF